jgi:hypothetical protein
VLFWIKPTRAAWEVSDEITGQKYRQRKRKHLPHRRGVCLPDRLDFDRECSADSKIA